MKKAKRDKLIELECENAGITVCEFENALNSVSPNELSAREITIHATVGCDKRGRIKPTGSRGHALRGV